MSSPKRGVAKTVRRTKATAQPTARVPATAAAPADAAGDEASATAAKLAAQIERALAEGRPDLLTPAAMQALMAALCRAYSAKVEAGIADLPLGGRSGVTSTDVMTTASGLLKAANLAVFELGMWQSWTGR